MFFPPMTEERREALRQAEIQHLKLEAEAKDHVCAECGGLLGMWGWKWGWDTSPLLACMTDQGHRGFRRLKGTYEKWVEAGRPREGTMGHVMTVCEENMRARQEVRRRIRKEGH